MACPSGRTNVIILFLGTGQRSIWICVTEAKPLIMHWTQLTSCLETWRFLCSFVMAERHICFLFCIMHKANELTFTNIRNTRVMKGVEHPSTSIACSWFVTTTTGPGWASQRNVKIQKWLTPGCKDNGKQSKQSEDRTLHGGMNLAAAKTV